MKNSKECSQEYVMGALASARANFLERDLSLIQYRANERSVAHRFAVYLEEFFPDWNVDCEYNRQGVRGDPKLDPKGKKRLPDIVVHTRGAAENLLVIEAKPDWATDRQKELDRQKLADVASLYGYRFAFVLSYSCGETADLWVDQIPV